MRDLLYFINGSKVYARTHVKLRDSGNPLLRIPWIVIYPVDSAFQRFPFC